ncbi:Cyanovirin-N [Whalleya microplaca]|nr:Cyanovirin-N [Whalleya microplaca]
MKLSSLILTVTMALLTVAQAQTGGFYSACSKTWTLGYRGSSHFMVDTCPRASSSNVSVTSTLDLNDCLGNREGAIEAVRVGHAFDTCLSCSGAADSSLLTCDCWTTDEFVKTSTFDLDTVVVNNDGVLACFDLPGFEVGASEL